VGAEPQPALNDAVPAGQLPWDAGATGAADCDRLLGAAGGIVVDDREPHATATTRITGPIRMPDDTPKTSSRPTILVSARTKRTARFRSRALPPPQLGALPIAVG
jgi:hypothetical protein